MMNDMNEHPLRDDEDKVDLDAKETIAAVFGMLKAGLMIGGIYLLAFAAFIVLLLLVWRAF